MCSLWGRGGRARALQVREALEGLQSRGDIEVLVLQILDAVQKTPVYREQPADREEEAAAGPGRRSRAGGLGRADSVDDATRLGTVRWTPAHS